MDASVLHTTMRDWIALMPAACQNAAGSSLLSESVDCVPPIGPSYPTRIDHAKIHRLQEN